MNKIYKDIVTIANKYKADKVVLFGSRARGDNRERSDIDIAVYGVSEALQAKFNFDIDDIDTLLDFDIVHINAKTSKELLDNIEKEGVIIMNKFDTKFSNFKNAIQRLKEAVTEYNNTNSLVVRDGAIQRFEFTTELAWKTLREYLLDQGYNDINSPKSVMKTAYSDKLINNEEHWIMLLNDRNVTSHIYNEEDANAVYTRIVDIYIDLFDELLNILNK